MCDHSTAFLENEHKHIAQWSQSVGLSLNICKSKFLWIPRSLNSPPLFTPIPIVKEVRILGVTFTHNLKWDTHFNSILKRVSSRLYALRILRPLLNKIDLKLVYHALILSTLEYCSPLFLSLNAKNRQLLSSLQNRAHRIICGKSCNENCLPDLCERRRIAAIKFLHKIDMFPDHPLHSMCPPKSSFSGRFLQPLARTKRRRNSFFPAVIATVNNSSCNM